mgnify:CR=1 FL=1
MNTKDILKKAITHVLTQGIQATDLNGVCQYKTAKEGKVLRCAVGGLISDDNYTSSLENHSISSLSGEMNAYAGDIVKAVNQSLGITLNSKVILYLRHIQSAHDSPVRQEDEFIDSFKDKIVNYVGLGHLPEYTLEFLKESK